MVPTPSAVEQTCLLVLASRLQSSPSQHGKPRDDRAKACTRILGASGRTQAWACTLCIVGKQARVQGEGGMGHR